MIVCLVDAVLDAIHSRAVAAAILNHDDGRPYRGARLLKKVGGAGFFMDVQGPLTMYFPWPAFDGRVQG
jgi:hypothetical protein